MTKAKKALQSRKAVYAKENYVHFSDAKLAKALNVDKKRIRDYLSASGLARTPEQERRIRENLDDPSEYRAELSIPPSLFPLTKKCIVPALAVFGVSFVVYMLTLLPTVGAEDGGELITAAYTLGVVHPPGYPLWCLLGKAFATAVPFGNIAYRVNLMSAFWAAGAAALLFVLAFKITGSIAASLGAGLSFAFFDDFWAQSVMAEVYTLNLFLIALVMLLLAFYYHRRELWMIWVLALVSGLTLAHHNTAAPVVVLAWMSVLYISPRRLLEPTTVGVSALLVLLGLCVFIYLPIRSAANPPMDWGNPETLSSALDHIMRQQYAFGFTENPRTLENFLRQLGVFAKFAASQGTIIFPLLALAGLLLLWKRDRPALAYLAAVVLICAPVLIFVINFELERESIETVKTFFLPVHLVMALLSAAALDGVIGSLSDRRAAVPISLAVASVFLVPLILNYHENDKSDYYYAYDYGMNLMKTVERDGIIFSSSDHSTFPLIYLQSVEGMRPDVTIADKYGYVEKDLYEGMPDELTSRFRKIPTPQERHMIERWIIENTDRPIYFTKKRDMQDMPGLKLAPWGLAYKLVKKSDPKKEERSDLWSEYELRCLHGECAYADYSAHSIIGDYHFARGREYLYHGAVQEAMEEFELVAEHEWGVKEVFNNLGSVCAENRLMNEAIGYFQKALEIDPEYLLALKNLSKLFEHLKDYAKAIDCQKRILAAGPDDHQATFNLARLHELSGDYESAIRTYNKAIETAPGDFRPFRALGFIYLSSANSRHRAPAMFVESLKRNPNQPDLEEMLVRLRGGSRN